MTIIPILLCCNLHEWCSRVFEVFFFAIFVFLFYRISKIYHYSANNIKYLAFQCELYSNSWLVRTGLNKVLIATLF